LGDADSYHAALAELKLEPFCYLFCRWVCLIVYERICRMVCSLEPIPLTDPAADIRAAGKSRSALSRTRMRRRPYRLARVGEIRPGNHPARSTERFSYDCMWRAEAHGRKGKSGCGVYLPDLEQPRPPDLPPGLIKLRLVKKG
jgi:hypothetical protein